MKIGIIAPSSQVPQEELKLGVQSLEQEGFSVRVHRQVSKSHWFFAGKDEERAKAFYEWAQDPEIQVLWCARGGYGAVRLLPHLEKLTLDHGVPRAKKLLVGYSDATALLEFVKTRWGWSALHGAMPSLRRFSKLAEEEWLPLVSLVRGEGFDAPWGKLRLKFAGGAPRSAVRGTLCGGNLAVWNAMIGSPYASRGKDRILFFEDIDETLPRLDRMVSQLLLSGSLEGVSAVVLGDFLACRDAVPPVLGVPVTERNRERLIERPKPQEMKPLRNKLDERKLVPQIFGQIREQLGIPVAYGLPVGHGPRFSPLPLGARYELTPQGGFRLLDWDWTSAKG